MITLLFYFQDPEGKVPLFWGITADGCVAFSDDIDLLKGSCGKSLAPFPQGNVLMLLLAINMENSRSSICNCGFMAGFAAGCFYWNALGGLKSYENPKNKVTAVPANEEEICGATFMVRNK